MISEPPAPLILTATFEPVAAAYFQALRRQHFPPKLNFIPAHLTLFHHLPGADYAGIVAALDRIARTHAPLPFVTNSLRKLGRGVAFGIQADELKAVRAILAAGWSASLTPQDRQQFQPHVTVQNKVAPTVALALHDELLARFTPLAGTFIGLDLWHYRGGPWEHAAAFPFSA